MLAGVFESFTDRAWRVVESAQEEARLLNHSLIGTEHLLLGLIHEGEGIAARALGSLGITLEAVREAVEDTVRPAGSSSTNPNSFTERAKEALELSWGEAMDLEHNYIGPEHLLLGLTREREGVAVKVLASLGVEPPDVRRHVMALLDASPARQVGRLQRKGVGVDDALS